MDAKIAPTHCLHCGQPIPDWRGGRGSPPKTCSEECRRERAKQREKERYQRVKHTDDWNETRAEYLAKLKRKMKRDPEFAAQFRERAARLEREYVTRNDTDPARRAERLRKKRETMQRYLRARPGGIPKP